MLATVTRNFSLEVADSSHHPILPSGPDNTTVEQGETAFLDCKVQSTSKPTIKWLKKLDTWEATEMIKDSNGLVEREDIFDLGEDNKFRAIRTSGENVQKGKNEYLNQLVIPKATEADAGMYYCFVTNNIGYKYKHAYLTVIPGKTLINMDSII